MPDVATLQQIERTQLQGRVVLYSDEQHLLIIDGAIIPCTPGEYDLLVNLSHLLACSVPRGSRR